ncbi:MAG: glycosyl transferase [Gammaproteobacteria bacterium]|nr:glycosyl transferase [Gammaproteobacteria bacterium]
MKILYGVQGTGNGHITRARVMASALSKINADVQWVFSGRPKHDFFDMECFGDYKSFRGLTFVTEHGKIKPFKTASQLNFKQLWKDIKSFDCSGYDIVINDFEPVTAWAARNQKVFSIGLSHQSAFLYDIPKKGSNVGTDLIMKWFAPVNLPIGVHWHHFNQPILPPIIESKEQQGAVIKNKILVYFPFQSLENLIQLVKPFSDNEFYIYAKVESATNDGHIHVRPFSRTGFQSDLMSSEGVVCGAGFMLASEAIQLGKKLYLQPVAGQMEQLSNALVLEQLGYANVSSEFNHTDLENWLKEFNPKKANFPNTAEYITNWLVNQQFNNPQDLVSTAWGNLDNQI